LKVAEDTTEENRQFEQVLNRLDALMKRSHATAPESLDGLEQSVPDDDPHADVPVLTEVYLGADLSPVTVAAQETPPLLTELVAESPSDAMQAVVDEVIGEPELLEETLVTIEQQVESMVEALMPEIREMVARVVQEEIYYAQQNLSLRIAQEAEQMLRQRLMQEITPK
jgi:hypothetical protein